MQMYESLEEVEQRFAREIALERQRRRSLIRTTEKRSVKREVQRRHKHGTVRFTALVMALIATAAVVTFAMFKTLSILLG